MSTNPVVSIVCLTYNHEKYVRKCLESFIMQKTSFPFEVIVHDDASTDNTADIIREYVSKYPDIIKPIFQKENQYSQNKDITEQIYTYIDGKYVALCEGDDYWCDENKLELQILALKDHPECKMSVHRVSIIEEDGRITEKSYPQFSLSTSIVSSDQFVSYICQEIYFQTSSYFFSGDEFRAFYNNLPNFRKVADVGDDPFKLYFANLGPICYIDRIMSCYRQNSSGNWSNSFWNTEKHFDNMIIMMKEFDAFSNGRFHKSCDKRIRYFEFLKAQKNKDYKALLRREYRAYFSKFSTKARILTLCSAYCPGVISFFHRFK